MSGGIRPWHWTGGRRGDQDLEGSGLGTRSWKRVMYWPEGGNPGEMQCQTSGYGDIE